MTALAIDFSGAVLTERKLPRSSRGGSAASQDLCKILEGALSHIKAPTVMHSPIDRAIEAVWAEFYSHQTDDWDGNGANPASLAGAHGAIKFLKELEERAPAPLVEVEPDGEIALEWHGVRGDIFSISFGDSGFMHFAGFYKDGSKIHGRKGLMDENLLGSVFEYIIRAS